jgi:uncharacterized protein YndB with AHSA1/START domain
MIDVRQQISAVRRELGTRTLEAGQARVSTISQVYDTDQDDLWEVVTNPERIARWFLPIEGELKEGGHYQLRGNAGGTVTRCDRPRGYAATWEFGDMVSWIEVRLTPEGDGRTRFELEHVAHVDDALWDQYGPGATGLGWESAVLGLANHLTDPAWVAPDQAEVMAWLVSDEGKALLRGSADGWAAAEVASGGDPATAQRHADTSYAAYTEPAA